MYYRIAFLYDRFKLLSEEHKCVLIEMTFLRTLFKEQQSVLGTVALVRSAECRLLDHQKKVKRRSQILEKRRIYVLLHQAVHVTIQR